MPSGTQVLQNAAITNVPGDTISLPGFSRALIEIQETAGGTATCTFEGSFDGSKWYACGYQPVVSATLTRSVTGVSVTANLATVYQLLDFYPQVRARISSVAGGATVTVKAYVA